MRPMGLLISLGILLISNAALSTEDNQNMLTFCRFGPKSKIFSPVHESKSADGQESCEGSAKIQAFMWECVPKEAVLDDIDKFKARLAEVGQIECNKHCETRGSHCKGKFNLGSGCALKTSEEEARTMGKEEGCRPSCSGNAFAYCSLYDAEYRMGTADLISKQKPNCFCAPDTRK